jgi:hypothetical protein
MMRLALCCLIVVSTLSAKVAWSQEPTAGQPSQQSQSAPTPTAPIQTPEQASQPPTGDPAAQIAEELRKTTVDLSSRVEELRKVRNEKNALAAENARLRDLIADWSTRAAIDNISLVDRFVTSNSAAFRLRGNRYGSLRVTLHDSSGAIATLGGHAAIVATGSSPELHDVTFAPLLPATSYWIEASAIKSDGNIGFTRMPSHIPEFGFTTQQPPTPPDVTILDAKPTATSMKVRYRLARADALIQAECFEQQEVMNPLPCGIVGSISQDPLGRTVGGPGQEVIAQGDREVEFRSLKPNRRYAFHIKAVTIDGARGESGEAKWYSTLEDFDFAGPVTLQLTPLGVTLSWKATAAITTGKIEIRYGEQDVAVSQRIVPDTTNPKSVSVSLPINDLSRILGKPLNQPPTLVALMDDGTKTVERQLRFSFAVPKDPTSQPGWQGLSDKQKEQIQALANQAQKKGKVDWKALAKAGLPIILSLF